MTVARTSNPMLNRSDMSGHSHVFPGFARKTFSFSLLRMMLALGLLQVAFIMLKNVPSMPTVMRVFSCRILSNAFCFFLHLLRQFCDFNPSFLNVFYHSDLLVSTFKNIYLFMAVLGLSRCAWAFSGCREHELLSSSGRQASH